MTELAMWLAGISFCAAVIAVIVAIAEHLRAKKAEQELHHSTAATTVLFEGISANHARSIVALAKRVEICEAQIMALAAASSPETYTTGTQQFIVVPGTRTRQ